MDEEIKVILDYWLNNKNYDVEYSGKVGAYLDIKAKAKTKDKTNWRITIDRDENGDVKCAANTARDNATKMTDI